MSSMVKQYGVRKAKEVFYKMVSAGTLTGVEKKTQKKKSNGARKRK